MTAPSCSGEFTKKMLRSSSLETSALTTVPVAIWSFRELVRSKTMSAPVLDSDMLAQARTVWFMTDSIVAGAPAAPKKYANLPEPMRSSRRRISGWNITTMAMRPSSTMRRMRLFTILIRAMSEMTSANAALDCAREPVGIRAAYEADADVYEHGHNQHVDYVRQAHRPQIFEGIGEVIGKSHGIHPSKHTPSERGACQFMILYIIRGKSATAILPLPLPAGARGLTKVRVRTII